jgi:hypothetical protein
MVYVNVCKISKPHNFTKVFYAAREWVLVTFESPNGLTTSLWRAHVMINMDER